MDISDIPSWFVFYRSLSDKDLQDIRNMLGPSYIGDTLIWGLVETEQHQAKCYVFVIHSNHLATKVFLGYRNHPLYVSFPSIKNSVLQGTGTSYTHSKYDLFENMKPIIEDSLNIKELVCNAKEEIRKLHSRVFEEIPDYYVVENHAAVDAIHAGDYKWCVSISADRPQIKNVKVTDSSITKIPPLWFIDDSVTINIHIPKQEIPLFSLKYGGIIKPSKPVKITSDIPAKAYYQRRWYL